VNLSPEREQALLALITQAIEAGAPAPSNPTICNVLGFKSIGSAAEAVQALERKGLIEVERGMNSRVIRLRGEATAPTIQSSFRRGNAYLDTMARVYREPCFFCGVRSDLGCKHGVAA